MFPTLVLRDIGQITPSDTNSHNERVRKLVAEPVEVRKPSLNGHGCGHGVIYVGKSAGNGAVANSSSDLPSVTLDPLVEFLMVPLERILLGLGAGVSIHLG